MINASPAPKEKRGEGGEKERKEKTPESGFRLKEKEGAPSLPTTVYLFIPSDKSSPNPFLLSLLHAWNPNSFHLKAAPLPQ